MRRRILAVWYGLLLILLPWLLVELLSAPMVVGNWRRLFGSPKLAIAPEGFLLMLAAFAGALGGAIHGAGSFAHHLSRRDFREEWFAWYLFRPLLGCGLAVLVYFALRGGFVPAGATEEVSPYGVGALSGLAGLFTWHATAKLRDVLDAIFGTSGKGGKDGPTGEPPFIEDAALEPGAGGGAELRLRGEGFPADSIVRVLGRSLEPIDVTPAAIRCAVPEDLAREVRSREEVPVELASQNQAGTTPLARATLRPPRKPGQDL